MARRRRPESVRGLEELGRVRLSQSFFLRDFLYSETAAIHAIANVPDDPDLAIATGRRLCQDLLEPLRASFGHVAIRSGYRCAKLNAFANAHGYNCSQNAKTHAGHIWDRRDADGCMGATACVVLPWFADRYAKGADWRALAWWIHDHLPYASLQFFPKLAAFNIQWHERPARRISSFIAPKGILTAPGMANQQGSHAERYAGFPSLQTR